MRGSYPDMLIRNLPPPRLTFFYPPHLRIYNEGYTLGWRWMASNPAAAARLIARKLAIFWSGASLGFTGWNLPTGRGDLRRPVDMTVPESAPLEKLVSGLEKQLFTISGGLPPPRTMGGKRA